MKDMGAWSRLTEEEREVYNKEAAAVRESRRGEELTPELRARKIKIHVDRIKQEVCKGYCIYSQCQWSYIKTGFALETF